MNISEKTHTETHLEVSYSSEEINELIKMDLLKKGITVTRSPEFSQEEFLYEGIAKSPFLDKPYKEFAEFLYKSSGLDKRAYNCLLALGKKHKCETALDLISLRGYHYLEIRQAGARSYKLLLSVLRREGISQGCNIFQI